MCFVAQRVDRGLDGIGGGDGVPGVAVAVRQGFPPRGGAPHGNCIVQHDGHERVALLLGGGVGRSGA